MRSFAGVLAAVLVTVSAAQPSDPATTMPMNKVTPIITVDAIEPCLPFWTDALGFEITATVPDEGAIGFAMLQGGEVELMYQSRAAVDADLGGGEEGLGSELAQSTTTLYFDVDDLDAVLPRADWLVVTANLTSETRGAISAERIALLPRGAHVLNVARGAIIDQDALTAALQSGALAGAYLDVFAPEPLPADSPLWNMPNVLISPHNSWAATGNPERARQIFLTNLEHWLRGDALPQEVFER